MLKATGIVRKVDELGRIVIPIELRRTLDLMPGKDVEIFTDDEGGIVLRRYKTGCMICRETKGTISIDGIVLCSSCAKKFLKEEK